MDNVRDLSRREFLRASKRWSGAVVGLVIAGGLTSGDASAQGAWVNRYGGGWVNAVAWANGGSGWGNRGGWINGGAGGWSNRGGSWGNGSAGSWVNRYGGGGWINRR